MDGHPPSKIFQREMYYRLEIWHRDLYHKIETRRSAMDVLGRAPTLEFRLKMVKFRPISDQIIREIQTKSDHFLRKFGLCA